MEVKVYNRKEACKVLKIGLSSLEKLLKSGELGFKKVGSRYLISSEHINNFLKGK